MLNVYHECASITIECMLRVNEIHAHYKVLMFLVEIDALLIEYPMVIDYSEVFISVTLSIPYNGINIQCFDSNIIGVRDIILQW